MRHLNNCRVCLGMVTALVVAGFCALSLAAQEGGPFAVGVFNGKSKLDGWTISLDREFSVAQGSLSRNPDEGVDKKGAASLEGVFLNGGTFVSMGKAFAKPIPAATARIKLKTSDVSGIVVRMQAADDQTFQQAISLADTNEWQEIFVDPKGVNSTYSGGQCDGVWCGALKGISIILEKGKLKRPDLKRGKLLVDLVEVLPPAAPL